MGRDERGRGFGRTESSLEQGPTSPATCSCLKQCPYIHCVPASPQQKWGRDLVGTFGTHRQEAAVGTEQKKLRVMVLHTSGTSCIQCSPQVL